MDEGYIELVLSAVEHIPRGQVASYGDIAELVGVAGPRLVGRVMSLHGAGDDDQPGAFAIVTYGLIADHLERGGARHVGRVMSLEGAAVPWWRVVRADGKPVRGLEEQALKLLRRDGTPLRDGRVDMRAARIRPSADPDALPSPGALP